MMKRIKTILLLLSLGMGLVACEDWLDVSATTQLDRKDLFKTENGYGEALVGIYAKMCDKSLYGRELTYHAVDMMAAYYPNIYYQHMAWIEYCYANPEAWGFAWCADYIEAIWNKLYAQIANLNSLLETIDGNQEVFSDDNYRLIKGEALGLRAFLHFEILRLFAGNYATAAGKEAIPYVTRLSSAVTPLYTQEDAIAMMMADLKAAKELLENDPMRLGTAPAFCLASKPSGENLSSDNIGVWHNRRFRFNYYAATATLARVCLWKGDKPEALRYAKEVIDDQEARFPWVESRRLASIGSTDPWSGREQDRSFATEHIFALNVTDLEDCMDGCIFNGKSGMAWTQEGLPITSQERSEVYENITADLRYQYWFEMYNGSFLISKFYQNSVVARYFQERLPLIRLSEMYYIAAECEPDPADGIEWLEEVRSHRGLSSFALSAGADLPAEICKEYRKEFWGEGQLWFYYKRTNNMNFSDEMTDSAFFTWAIPDTEISNAGR